MIQDEIMKLQTYKMFEGDSDVYVERDDVLEILKQYIDLTDIVKTPKQSEIPKQPIIDVDMLREIKLHDTGEMIDKRCPVCGWHINPWIEEYSFCPNCGAKMEVKE